LVGFCVVSTRSGREKGMRKEVDIQKERKKRKSCIRKWGGKVIIKGGKQRKGKKNLRTTAWGVKQKDPGKKCFRSWGGGK